MGVSAPSKGDVGSVAPPRAFAELLENEDSVLKLLVSIRGSSLKKKDKLELRDLILDYAASPPPEKAKLAEKINQTLSTNELDFLPLVGRRLRPAKTNVLDGTGGQAVPAQSASGGFGRSRPAPSFDISRTPKAPEPIEVESAPAPKPPEPTPPPAKPPLPKADEIAPSAPPVAEATENQASTPTPAPTPVPAETAPATNSGILARINEIKHAVNSKIGNPVNLISQDKTIGQEYMSALLDAMKKANSGIASESDVAMTRLEAAYDQVEKLIASGQVTAPDNTVKETKPAATTPATSQPSPTPSPAPATKLTINKNAAPAAPARPSPTPSQTSPTILRPVASMSAGQPDEERLAKESEELDTKLARLTKAPLTPAAPSVRPEKPTPPPATPPVAATPPASEPAKPSGESIVELTPNASKLRAESAPMEPTKIRSVANVTTLPEKMTALKDTLAEKKKASEQQIEGIDSPDVKAGLEQLLSEWKLFKNSGFLGTGPGGVDHPLYKRLANLPMASVISGRFEGVTPEIKQSITSYMNGWRYEHGIVHEMGETFEHYLRRVIKQILNAQRKEDKSKEEKKTEEK